MKHRWIGLILAITFSVLSWVYTIKKDYWKFILSIILIMLTVEFVGPITATIMYVWAILDHILVPETHYTDY